ncbi:MAG: sodium:solute symporter family protein [Candidatus Marinimicrobia bacterium]|jgi:SSS family solute:Na+ symporter|nr:sodium:solute symporter family protein [Candidatus Neomarinimicrobiota bacterium]MBT3630572.1 sodium:solute symporter family protein [Candidatus Neomarinimicrobiota bacterium]MBT3823359.1 sodium:solute symporter family protein [Candidatus Neomarinimicrobiota bacterium]MBT4131424.1 sodium:solute symporter family protein [Candidatus Neomarinimicrobiota bacterium]MBT4295859.1 sodium:solute symporter family protein [Candidatus Neomarinimicrobiota bacterium]
MNLHLVDIGLILVYFIAVLLVGIYNTRTESTTDYMLMGRKLTLPAFVMTLVSTWYGGILGVSEYSTSYGISNWVIFGLPYYVFGIAFALMVAKRARSLEVNSLPEILASDYGINAGRLASVWVLLLASPAPYILTLGLILNFFLGLNLVIAIIAGAVFSLFYILNGGLTSVIKTDKVQFVLMFLGFMVILIVLAVSYMNPIDLWHTLPESHTSWTGGQSFGYIVVWFFIGSWTMVDPGFHQRVYATTTQSIAKRGILWAVLFWFIFDLMTTLTGLYAFSYLPPETIPTQAFLVLGNAVLPLGLQGLFYVGILATVMSTLDSNTLVSGITLGKDIIGSYPTFRNYSTNHLIKVSMVIVLLIGIIMAVWIPSVIDLWYTFGTIAIPALLIPTLMSIFKKPLTRQAVFLNLSIPPIVSFLWFLFGKIDEWSYFWGLEPFYPGLFCSLLILIVFKRSSKEVYIDE